MFLQNLLKSDDRRLSKRVVQNQREEEEDDTFYQTTKEKLTSYKIDADKIEEMTKSGLKEIIKARIEKKMATVIGEASKRMTKLRFTMGTEAEFKRKEYLMKMNGIESLHTLKTRLNMLPVFSNFKGDITKESVCTHCKKEEDNTEHLVECTALGETFLKKDDLRNSNNIELWKLINERTRYNLENRPKNKETEEESSRSTPCYS